MPKIGESESRMCSRRNLSTEWWFGSCNETLHSRSIFSIARSICAILANFSVCPQKWQRPSCSATTSRGTPRPPCRSFQTFFNRSALGRLAVLYTRTSKAGEPFPNISPIGLKSVVLGKSPGRNSNSERKFPSFVSLIIDSPCFYALFSINENAISPNMYSK